MKIIVVYSIIVLVLSTCCLLAADSVSLAAYDKSAAIRISEGDTVPVGHELEIQIYIANDTIMSGLSLGFKVFADEFRLSSVWDSQAGGLGASAAVTVTPGSRLDPINSTIDFFNIFEHDFNGNLPDSILVSGAAFGGAGLAAGPAEHLLSLHLTPQGVAPGERVEICIDSAFIPPVGDFLFISKPSGLPWKPYFSGKFCFTIADDQTKSNLNSFVVPNFDLKQNRPNPFNQSTAIEYSLKRASLVNITIYNILGQAVKTLISHRQNTGEYQVIWAGDDENGTPLASGIYFYRMTAGKYVKVRQMMLIR